VRVLTGARDGLLPALVATAGQSMRDLSVSEPTLETVFITLTGRNLRD
jgi:ABC-2 type transport system ATP-binding protein